MIFNFDKSKIIRKTSNAINIKILSFDCWIPLKKIKFDGQSIILDVNDDFTFKLQQYSPQIDIIRTAVEVNNMIISETNKKHLEFDFSGNFGVFDITNI